MKYPIPTYLTVQEVSLLTDLTKQEVRRKCASGEFIGHQRNGENGIWSIEKSQFSNHPNWNNFIKERDEEIQAAYVMSIEKAENDEAAIVAEREYRQKKAIQVLEERKNEAIQKAIRETKKRIGIEVASRMIDIGLDDAMITRTTNVTKEEIQSLRENKQ
ncbi:hypothetical protein COA01_23140 [Bacillus cereus]|uniref:hypothetical protein n=1 Tax=Bacillus cereus TaxID=1396 RepID=UPI000BFE3857|nr:hypothetical protein [Bacillus cereus]PGP18640.1 hypothetical protein COA01_23140 [Bacillus cereus]